MFKEVLFNDGEGIEHSDFNELQRYLRALILDGVVADVAQGIETDVYPPLDQVFVQGSAGAITATVNTREVNITQGTIYQAISNGVTGSDPVFLAYRIEEDELLTTLTVGDAANPRYDIIQVSLSHTEGGSESRDFEDAATRAKTTTAANKTRSVTLAWNVKEGTPAATPAVPSPDAGYVTLAAIRRPANHNAAVTNTDLRDYRMPIGLKVYEVSYAEMLSTGVWTMNDYSLTYASGTGSISAVCPVGNLNARLVKVGAMLRRPAASTAAVSISRPVFAASSAGGIEVITSNWPADGTSNYVEVAPSLPVWCNGWHSGIGVPHPAVPGTTGPQRVGVRVQVSADTGHILYGGIRFFVAGG